MALYLRERGHGNVEQRMVANGLARNFALGAALWLISAAVPPPWRYALWTVSIAIDVGAPLMRGGALAQVPVDASHLPERFGLLVIIVLGDAVVTTGTGLARIKLTGSTITVASACFVIAAVIWWAYFDRAESNLRSHVDESAGSGLLARDVYSYAHFPIVVGITFAAAGARLMLAGQSGAQAGRIALCLGQCGAGRRRRGGAGRLRRSRQAPAGGEPDRRGPARRLSEAGSPHAQELGRAIWNNRSTTA